MLREARVYDKSEVYQLWKQSYPTLDRNYLNFYFKHLFDSGVCLIEEKDQKIVSSLQMNRHVLQFAVFYVEYLHHLIIEEEDICES